MEKMDILIRKFSPDRWTKSDPASYTDFKQYTMVRHQMVKPGTYKYAAKQLHHDKSKLSEGKPSIIYLEGAKEQIDPLEAVMNVELILKEDRIIVINVDGDCVAEKPI